MNLRDNKTTVRAALIVAGSMLALGMALGAWAQEPPALSPRALIRELYDHMTFGPGETPDQKRAARRPIARIPFELSRNRILIRDVSLGGPERFLFVFDSGAQSSGLDATAWDRLGLKADEQVTASGAGGTMTTDVKKNVQLSIGGVSLGEIRLMKRLPRPTVSKTGESSSGTIGVDLLKRFVVTIDFDERTLDLYDPKTYVPDGRGDALDIIFWNEIAHVAGGADLGIKDGRGMTPEGMARAIGKADLEDLLKRIP